MTTNYHTPIAVTATNNVVYINAPLSQLDATIYGIVTGTVPLTGADINGSTIDGTVIGGTSAAAATFSSMTATTATISGGTINNTTIGATTASSAIFSALTTSSGTMDFGGTMVANRNNTNQTIATATVTVLQLNATELNPGTWFDTATYRYTPLVAGRYMAHASVRWNTTVDQCFLETAIRWNGNYLAVSANRASGAGNINCDVTSKAFTMNGSSDYLDVTVQQQSGVNLDVDGTINVTFFTVWRVG